MERYTKRDLEAVKPRPGGRFDVRNPKWPAGLVLVVMPSGLKTWYWRKWLNGQPVRERIGPFPEVTISTASTRANLNNGQQATGEDAAAIRRAQREELTLGGLWTLYQNGPAKAKRRWETEAARWSKYLAPWAARRCSDITADKMKHLTREIGETAPVQANRVRALVRMVFNWGIGEGLIPGPNPVTKAVKRHAEEPRDRYLDEEEMRRLLLVLRDWHEIDLAHWCQILLFTGVRSHSAYAMRWQDVDLASRSWTIPQESLKQSKRRKRLEVPLAQAVCAILEDRQRYRRAGNPWVFPSSLNPTGHVVNFYKGFGDLLKAAKLTREPRPTPHDLRRTHATWMETGGVPREVTKRALGHTLSDVTDIYARTPLYILRIACERTVAAMLATVEEGKVLTMPTPAWAREGA